MIGLMESDISAERFLINAENWSYNRLFTETARQLGIKPPATEMFIEYKPNNTRKGLINKNCSVIYRVKASHIQLLVFWDNRKNPKKAP